MSHLIVRTYVRRSVCAINNCVFKRVLFNRAPEYYFLSKIIDLGVIELIHKPALDYSILRDQMAYYYYLQLVEQQNSIA